MWIDIGATSRIEAEELVELGDVVTYQHELQMLIGDRATARARPLYRGGGGAALT
jgi:endoglucanase